jgi:Rieske Fe-S protein
MPGRFARPKSSAEFGSIKQKDGSVKALNVTCPHLGCPVNFEGGKFVCPCHNATYTLDGVRTNPGAGRKNPALRDMDDLRVEVKGDEVRVEYLNFYSNIPEKKARS